MRCPYSNICCDANTKCGTCMHNEKRSYYVEHHGYPADKLPILPSGDDLRFPGGNTTLINYGLEIPEEVRPWYRI